MYTNIKGKTLKPLKNNIIYKRDMAFKGAKSDIIHVIDPEIAWIVESVGPKVIHVKPGDRIAVPSPIKHITEDKSHFIVPESDVLAIYEKTV